MELNTFGYPIIARETMDQFFGARPDDLSKDQDRLIRETLRGLDVPLPVDYDDGLYDYEIPLPPMMGDNIYEHFEQAADQFVGDAVNRMDNFTKCDVPKFPRSLMEFSKGKLTFNDVEINPGWTRISFEDWSVSQVDNPLEDTIIFDTETFVHYHNYPIMGTAVSDKAYYLWLARETLHPSLPKNCWDQQDFIDIGKGKVVVAHNASFDRVRTQTPYSLEERHDNLWFDTLSFHVCVAGLASGQRYYFALKNKNKEDLTNKDRKKLRYKPSWSDQGTTNSLVKCFNHHVAEWTHHEKLTESDKKVRDLFVTAKSMKEIYDNLKKLVVYALDDAYYTFLLNKHLWPKYRDCTPSLTAIAGHVYLLNSKIPLINEWNEWITECETIYDKLQSESANLVTEICHQLYDKWIKLFKEDLKDLDFRIWNDDYGIILDSGTDDRVIEFMEKHPVLKGELWDKKNERWKSTLFKNKDGKYKQPSTNIKVKLYSLLNPEWCQVANSLFKGDDWLTQLDWTPVKYLGKWTPNWYKPWVKNPDNSLTNKSVTMHLLLKLTWRGCPVIKTKEDGFCFISNELLPDIDEPLIEKTEDERFIYKIPHKDGWDNNVGVLLSKDYLTYYESEVMGGEGENAKRVLEIGVATSYWTSIRKRVMARFVKGVNNPFGKDCNLTLPEITPNGTVTRRATEPLFLTMCGVKPHKIATEFKTRIESPDGWKIVMADVDSEEMAIASIFADKWFSGHVGSSALAYEVLSGSKDNGSDSHTRTAKEMILDDLGYAFIPGHGWCKEV